MVSTHGRCNLLSNNKGHLEGVLSSIPIDGIDLLFLDFRKIFTHIISYVDTLSACADDFHNGSAMYNRSGSKDNR